MEKRKLRTVRASQAFAAMLKTSSVQRSQRFSQRRPTHSRTRMTKITTPIMRPKNCAFWRGNGKRGGMAGGAGKTCGGEVPDSVRGAKALNDLIENEEPRKLQEAQIYAATGRSGRVRGVDGERGRGTHWYARYALTSPGSVPITSYMLHPHSFHANQPATANPSWPPIAITLGQSAKRISSAGGPPTKSSSSPELQAHQHQRKA